MKLPRDLSGSGLASLLRRYGYDVTRQTGSHLRLTSRIRGPEHHITIPRHAVPKVGTLSGILADVAVYFETDRESLAREFVWAVAMYLGLDPTMSEAKATAWAVVDANGRLVDAGKRYADADLLALAGEFGVSTVAIDAPLGYPRGMCCLEASCACAPVGDTLRACERTLIGEGISLYPTTKRSFIKPMVYRAIGLAREYRAQGRSVLEVYPYAAKVRLWGKPIPKKTTPEGLRWLRERVAGLGGGSHYPPPHAGEGLRAAAGRRGEGDALALADHDACDAVLAAYTAYLYAQGGAEALGLADEGQIVVPVGCA